MLKNITDGFSHIVQKITKKGRLTETQIQEGIRSIRLALIEAEVNIEAIKKFIAKLKEKALHQEIVKNVQAGDMLVKIVHDLLVETLGQEKISLNLKESTQITGVLLSGLQGSGKTTTLAKMAYRYKNKRDVLTVSLDFNRPAANEQLKILSKQAGVAFYDRGEEKNLKKIVHNVFQLAKRNAHNLIFFDTAGRTQIDEGALAELTEIHRFVKPDETLLVMDSMMGQQALPVANRFKAAVPLNGLIFSKFDSDNRGGAVLSVKEVVGVPVKFIGVGERIDELDEFDPKRIAERILGMGDIVGLVEKAKEVVDEEEAKRLSKKLKQNKFDFEDYLAQIRQFKKMGSLSSIVSMMPGMANKINPENIDEGEMKVTEAIILSMTPFERKEVIYFNNSNSRKMRVAKGSGTNLLKVNKVLKKFFEMKKMMKNFQNSRKMKKVLTKMGMNESDLKKISQKMEKR